MFQYVIDIAIFLTTLAIFIYVYALAWRFWIIAIQTEYASNINWILLEIKLPRIVDKSPKAFEIAASAFLQAGGIANRYKVFWKGGMPIYHSLEIVSLQGEIHFYIRTESKFKSIIMNNIYSQYPTVEITEVDDYMSIFKMTHHTSDDKFAIWGINYNLSTTMTLGEKDGKKKKGLFNFILKIFGMAKEADKDKIEIKASYLPISTYIDYAMDKDPKEIFKHDPLTPVLEWLGSLGTGQYGIYQICISDESNFKGKVHSLASGAKGDGKWPALYEDPTDNKGTPMKNLATIARMRLDQIRTTGVKVKKKKGEQVYDNYGNPVTKKEIVKTGEKDENGKDKTEEKTIYVTYGMDMVEGGDRKKEIELTTEEKNEIELINRKISKPTFAATVRSAFIVLDDHDEAGPQSVNSTLSMLKQYSRSEFNNYGLSGPPATGGYYDYGWQNTMKKKAPWRDEEFFESLVERECFFAHANFDAEKDTFWDIGFWNQTLAQKKMWRMIHDSIFHPFTHVQAGNVFVINTEELASLYHFPGEVAATPGLKRIDSVKSDAPNNLPI